MGSNSAKERRRDPLFGYRIDANRTQTGSPCHLIDEKRRRILQTGEPICPESGRRTVPAFEAKRYRNNQYARAHPVDSGGYDVAASQSVEAGEVYETYVYNITGSRYFSVENDGDWTLWVIEGP